MAILKTGWYKPGMKDIKWEKVEIGKKLDRPIVLPDDGGAAAVEKWVEDCLRYWESREESDKGKGE